MNAPDTVGAEVAVPAELAEIPRAHAQGVLAGRQVTQRKIAQYAYDAGWDAESVLELTRCCMICGAESWRFDHARNDNLQVLRLCSSTQVVANPQTGQRMTVLNPAIGRVQLDNGTIENLSPDMEMIVSRDCGLMQINIRAAEIGSPTETRLYDPAQNFAAAYSLYLNRGWQPWVAFNTGVYLHDTYLIWALMGTANMSGEILRQEAIGMGQTPKTRLPWLTLKEVKMHYPDVVLG